MHSGILLFQIFEQILMIPSEHRKVSPVDKVQDFLGGSSITDQITQQQDLFHPPFLEPAKGHLEGLEIGVDIGQEGHRAIKIKLHKGKFC